MKGLRKVVWAEGVFLGQQHFQAWDQYQFRTQHLRSRWQQPYSWGVGELIWDEAALLNGRLDLVRCQALLPDGRVVDYRRETDGPVFLDLTQFDHETLTLCLMLPRNELADTITGYEVNGRLTGWTSDYTDLEDEYDAGRRREVLLARPNLKLQPEFQAQDNMVSMPLARVTRRYDAEYQLDESFLPPLLQVGSAARLKQLVTNLVDLLQSQFRSLQERRLKLGDLSSMTATEMADYLLQAELVSALAELRTFEQHPQQTPFELYKLLVRSHDRLALQLMPDELPLSVRYQHDQLTDTFASLNTAMRQVLGVDRQRSADGLVFTSIAPGRYESSALSEATADRCTFYLSVRHSGSDPTWFTRFPQYFKLGAPDQIETMVSNALPGLPLQHTQRLPQKIRIKSECEYFLLDKSSPVWADIRRAGQFAAFGLGDFVSADVELLVIEE